MDIIRSSGFQFQRIQLGPNIQYTVIVRKKWWMKLDERNGEQFDSFPSTISPFYEMTSIYPALEENSSEGSILIV